MEVANLDWGHSAGGRGVNPFLPHAQASNKMASHSLSQAAVSCRKKTHRSLPPASCFSYHS